MNYIEQFKRAFIKNGNGDPEPEPAISPAAAYKISARLGAALQAVVETRSALNMLAIGMPAEIPFELLEKAELDIWFEDQIAQALKGEQDVI